MPSLIMVEAFSGVRCDGVYAEVYGRPSLGATASAHSSSMLHCEMERPTYQQHVPSVARAVQALERLAAAGQPLSLSTLSRALEVGPSSLLAILTTLRSAGLVSRSTRDGRYTPGPSLVALG